MKKNLYKYAAMAVIVQVLNKEAEAYRNRVECTKEHYMDDEDGIPAWAQDEIDTDTAIADFLDDFISKL